MAVRIRTQTLSPAQAPAVNLTDIKAQLRITTTQDDAWLTRQWPIMWSEVQRYARIVAKVSMLDVIYVTGEGDSAIPMPPGGWKPRASALTVHQIYDLSTKTFVDLEIPAVRIDGRIVVSPSRMYRSTVTFGVVDGAVEETLSEAALRLLAFRYDNRGSPREGANSMNGLLRSGAADTVKHWRYRSIER